MVDELCFTYNCSNYNLSNYVCYQCQKGFVLVEQTCNFANCLNPTQRTCPTCLPGFNLTNGLCYAPIDYCQVYDQNVLVCLQCIPNYEPNSYGICISNFIDPYCLSLAPQSTTCLQCFPNFSYNAATRQCENNYCLRFNPTTQTQGRVCVGCLPGFMLDPSGKYCISIYCARYDLASGQCWGCVGGSSLDGAICRPSHCTAYSNTYPSSPVCQAC
jgi:hypothetical protein